jgi:lactoylglutathione lyase
MTQLGTFSISLIVKDLAASRAFYEKLGFTVLVESPRNCMMKNGDAVIGLFHNLFPTNTITFNPTDVRAVHAAAKAAGIAFTHDPVGDTGPGWAMAIDPDGNPVLLDQH